MTNTVQASWDGEPFYPVVGQLRLDGYPVGQTVPLVARDPERIGETTATDVAAIERQLNGGQE